MRLSGLLTPSERRAMERAVPGLALDAIDVSPLPQRLTGMVPSLGGITIGHRILVRPDVFEGDRDLMLDLLTHELVHVGQWRRHGPLGFSLRYLTDYLVLRLRGHGHAKAYLGIPAEEEARRVATRRTGVRSE